MGKVVMAMATASPAWAPLKGPGGEEVEMEVNWGETGRGRGRLAGPMRNYR
jgi:hypothetical protein